MSNLFVILWMLFFHIVDDYYLQGCLASMKQKSWWKEKAPDKMYEHDYIWALIVHSCSWAFMIMLPIAYVQQFNIGFDFMFMFAFNVVMHASVDHLKANMKMINLWQDQFAHLTQIVLTYVVLYI